MDNNLAKSALCAIRLFFMTAACLLSGAPAPAAAVPQQLSNSLRNCQVEIEMLQKSIESQEEARLALEKDVRQIMKATKESAKDFSSEAQNKVRSMEKQVEKIVSDLKELKGHINEIAAKVGSLQEDRAQQSKAISSLEKALRALTVGLQSQQSSACNTSSDSSYTVQPGDSLEKIAKRQGTSVKALKNANNLSSNNIKAGQVLIIPASP